MFEVYKFLPQLRGEDGRERGGRHMIGWMLAARIDPLGAVIALSVALGLVVGIEMGRRCK